MMRAQSSGSLMAAEKIQTSIVTVQHTFYYFNVLYYKYLQYLMLLVRISRHFDFWRKAKVREIQTKYKIKLCRAINR